jgi:hypothetical protein
VDGDEAAERPARELGRPAGAGDRDRASGERHEARDEAYAAFVADLRRVGTLAATPAA